MENTKNMFFQFKTKLITLWSIICWFIQESTPVNPTALSKKIKFISFVMVLSNTHFKTEASKDSSSVKIIFGNFTSHFISR